MRMFLISDNIDTQVGIRLSGVEGVVVHEESEVKAALKKALNDNTIGIVLITEKLAVMIKDYITKIKLEDNSHLIVEIPDRHGSVLPKDRITSYVRDAIGLRI